MDASRVDFPAGPAPRLAVPDMEPRRDHDSAAEQCKPIRQIAKGRRPWDTH